ncbi:MAG: glutamate 5-kinase [Prevotella sp.]|nr:glutamate 5-kinase [Prevotella sp.]
MKQRIVVKVGSNVLTRADGTLNITRISAIVDQIAELRKLRHEVILVSSGAVASGRSELRVDSHLDSVEQRQLFSAIGQVRLINHYYDLFREHNIHIGQVLTMKDNFRAGEQYQNQKACMQLMLDMGVLPIVNENDTVALTELMFTDNDELSGLIAKMLKADKLILLSNIDGIYDGDPKSPTSKVIETVEQGHDLSGLIAKMLKADKLILLSNIDGIYDGDPKSPTSKVIETVEQGHDLSEFIHREKSSFGRGGMESKYHTASEVAKAGITVIIANGTRDNILVDLITQPQTVKHTEFLS